MKQHFHTIIRPEANGWFVGWVEEVPGAMTHGKSLTECRQRLRDALSLMIETHRHEARLALTPGCIEETVVIDAVPPLCVDQLD